MSNALTSFRQNVQVTLESKGLTLTQMAEDLDISRSGLSRMIHGHGGITLDRAEKIANYLGVSLPSLIQPTPRRMATPA